MTTLKQINEFIDSQPIALVGVSRNPKKFGHTAFKELHEKGMNIIPVNPEADEIMGQKVFRNVSLLPPDVGGIIIMTKKDRTAAVIREAKEKGIKQIWIQQMADSKEAIEELKSVENVEQLESIRIKYFGRRGRLTEVMRGISQLSKEERPIIGQLANEIREHLNQEFDRVTVRLKQKEREDSLAAETIDMTLPGRRPQLGRKHPLRRLTEFRRFSEAWVLLLPKVPK